MDKRKPIWYWIIVFVVIGLMLYLAIGSIPITKGGQVPIPGGIAKWTKVLTDPIGSQVNALTTYNRKLYCAIEVMPNAIVKRYNGGNSWSQIGSVGFGNPNNNQIISLVTYNDKLYASTDNDDGTEVWAYNGKNWKQVNTSGFGLGDDAPFCNALVVYKGSLYAIVSYFGSGQINFRVYCYNGSGTTWTRVDTNSWGAGNDGLCAISFNGYLYVGAGKEWYGDGQEAQVWRYDGANWKKVSKTGFGAHELSCQSFAVYNNKLYCGTEGKGYISNARVYRFDGGTSWSAVSSPGFNGTNDVVMSLCSMGKKLYAGTYIGLASGKPQECQVWSYNGSSWILENTPGFGEENLGAMAMAVYNAKLYVGTYGRHAEIWCTDGSTPNPPKPYVVYLAEGSTDYGFSEYISIENPNPTPVTVRLTYQTKDGPVGGPQFVMPAKSQATVNPADTLGANDFSTKVECLQGKLIAADRTMTWTGPGAASPEAHNSIGVTAPAKTWYLPEGSSAWGFECWLLIQNPNAAEANCKVTYMIENEGPKVVNHKIPASSRATFNMTDDIGAKDASIRVESNIPVISERAMYRNNRREGHDSIGVTAPASDYYLAEGTSAWGFTTYVLVQNPNDSANQINVTYMTNDGPRAMAPFEMPPNSRKTIRVNDVLPNVDFSTEVHGSQPIIAERAMYWNNGTGEACHDSIGMAQPHTTFYLPDGQTSDGRETWTLVQNPNSSLVEVEISYLTPDSAGNVVFTDTIPANSRRTYNMADKGIVGRAAVMVQSQDSNKKIMVERAMYWNNRGAGTDTIGGYSDPSLGVN